MALGHPHNLEINIENSKLCRMGDKTGHLGLRVNSCEYAGQNC